MRVLTLPPELTEIALPPGATATSRGSVALLNEIALGRLIKTWAQSALAGERATLQVDDVSELIQASRKAEAGAG